MKKNQQISNLIFQKDALIELNPQQLGAHDGGYGIWIGLNTDTICTYPPKTKTGTIGKPIISCFCNDPAKF